MKINWTVRIKNKSFWVALIPAVLILIQAVASVFGFTLDFGTLGGNLLAVVDAVFAVLAIIGIVTDPTTEGLGDSDLAMTYDTPKPTDADTRIMNYYDSYYPRPPSNGTDAGRDKK